MHVQVPMFFRECAFGAQVWCCTAHGVTVHSLRTDSRENTALVMTPLQGACSSHVVREFGQAMTCLAMIQVVSLCVIGCAPPGCEFLRKIAHVQQLGSGSRDKPLRCGPWNSVNLSGCQFPLIGRKTDRTGHLSVHLQNLTVGKRAHSAALLSFDLIHQRFVA